MENPPFRSQGACEKINNQQLSCILPDFTAFVKDGTKTETMDK
jgi:hypothetical protein